MASALRGASPQGKQSDSLLTRFWLCPCVCVACFFSGMADVYEYPANIDGLLEFCERQYCAENLQFLLAVRNFRKLKTWDEVQHCAWEIMEE